jgi:hypothetical protein
MRELEGGKRGSRLACAGKGRAAGFGLSQEVTVRREKACDREVDGWVSKWSDRGVR